MTTPSIQAPKTTVNRLLLFLLIGFTTAVPILIFGLFIFSWINILFMPLVIFVVLIVMAAREKRFSLVKPGGMEYLLSFLGAFYPPVLVAIILWLVWWGIFAIGAIFFNTGDLFDAVYEFAGLVYGILSLGFAVFLVRLNWRHVANQLYPPMGSQTAFAQITETGKMWLIKRGFLFSIIFFVMLVIYFVFSGFLFSEGEDLTVGDELLLGLFFMVIYIFIITVSAWLWLRKPVQRFGVPEINKALSQALKLADYKVSTITELKNNPKDAVEISDFMTASVDLVASNVDGSLVIDIMTMQETTKTPDWVMASEFCTATGYLQSVLQLTKPVEGIFVLVDVLPDDSLLAYAESQNIKLIQLTSEEVGDWLVSDGSMTTLSGEAAAIISSIVPHHENGASSQRPVLENGGQNG